MLDKVFIGGLCPKFIICSDWSVNGNGIVNCGNGRGGVGDNFKKIIWGVMLLCVADFSSGEMQ